MIDKNLKHPTYISLHSLQRVAAWTNDQTDKVYVRVLVLWNQHLLANFSLWRPRRIEKLVRQIRNKLLTIPLTCSQMAACTTD